MRVAGALKKLSPSGADKSAVGKGAGAARTSGAQISSYFAAMSIAVTPTWVGRHGVGAR
jgi:hypothetical protein